MSCVGASEVRVGCDVAVLEITPLSGAMFENLYYKLCCWKKQEDLSVNSFASSLDMHIQTSYFSTKSSLSKIIYPSAVLYLHFSAAKGGLGTSSSSYSWSTWVIGCSSEHVSSCIYGYLWSSSLERWMCFVSEDPADSTFFFTFPAGLLITYRWLISAQPAKWV